MENNLKEHVIDLHRRAVTVDAHFDLTYDLANRRERGEKKVVENRYLPHFREGGFNLIVSAMFIDDLFLPEMGLRKALDQISFLHDEMEESPGLFRICRKISEVHEARAKKEVAIILSLEGADPIGNDIQLLRVFYELGVRGVGLVWSRRNYVADGAFFDSRAEGKKGGLTPFGVELVRRAEQLGMFIDVSHLNDEGFFDVLDIAEKPLVASHSNCRELASTMRNLTDEQIRAVGKNGGVIGMNSVNKFTRPDKDTATVADLVDHVDHVAGIAGVEHVGMGFDICNSFVNYLNIKEPLIAYDIIENHSRLGDFTKELIIRGYSDDDILRILGGNFLRVYEEVMG